VDGSAKISVTAGDIEFELEGTPTEIEEMLTHLRQDDTWEIMMTRLNAAKIDSSDSPTSGSESSTDADRGVSFRNLIETCALKRKPDQVLGALHFLRDVEGIMDSPPRVINQLFDDAGIESPGNLSLYLNRLREREFLIIPEGSEDKNRFAILSTEGKAHIEKRSSR
tara:strand:+ start:853 stop:1353 length:501 start_codon:yes stop_codon:yes gene_type:complete